MASDEEEDIRQVAGCLPIHHETKEILLITNKKKDGWVIPKGGIEEGENPEEAATRETLEEAGVAGPTQFLGTFEERTKKGKVKSNCFMYELDIREVHKKYKEKKKRERRFFKYSVAKELLRAKPYMLQALEKSSIASTANVQGYPNNEAEIQSAP